MPKELSVIQKAYDLVKLAVPEIARFPRSHRFVLGERMERALYDALDDLIVAKFSREKVAALERVNLTLEQFRFQGRLAHDLGCLPAKTYARFSVAVDAVGREVGGWLKHVAARAGGS